MTGPEHYKEAERLLDLAEENAQAGHDFAEGMALANAQVHATLANTAAIMQQHHRNDAIGDDWAAVLT